MEVVRELYGNDDELWSLSFDFFLHDALCQISAACLNEFPKWLSTVAGRFSVDITFWHAGENLARSVSGHSKDTRECLNESKKLSIEHVSIKIAKGFYRQ